MRPIDADALLRSETERCGTSPVVGTCTMNNRFLHRVLDEAPTLDVAPVVHGRWTIECDNFDCEFMRCSVCGEEFYNGDNDTVDMLPNYCPNCGAKMDGDTDV